LSPTSQWPVVSGIMLTFEGLHCKVIAVVKAEMISHVRTKIRSWKEYMIDLPEIST
jgi:hypothetical protein